jgi:hypothetical protein
MGTHIEELRTIENDQINMARFFKVAFHCHSPMSNDWGSRKDIDKTNPVRHANCPSQKIFYKLPILNLRAVECCV